MAQGSYIGQVQIGSNYYPVGSILYGTATYDSTNGYWKTGTGTGENLTSDTFDNDNLATGVTIHVKFAAASNSNKKLKVGGASDKTITCPSGTVTWAANSVISLTYDGTNWVMNTGTIPQGTVTSVKIETTSPVTGGSSTATTTSGSYTIALADGYGDTKNPYGSKTKNYVLAAGASANGVPSFRALVSADIPSSVALSGTPTAPTANAGTNTTQIATTAFVTTAISNSFAANDAMQFKGTIAGGSTGNYGALTAAANSGDTYKVSTAGKINGVPVEVGDMLICTVDSTAAATADNYATIAANWAVIQTNIDGAVTGPSSATDGNFALFNGATGKIIKNSSYSPSSFAAASHTQAVNKGGTNITSYDIGDILYASASTTLAKLNGNTTTTRKFLTSVAATSGTAVAPKWDTLTKSDVGLSHVEDTALSTWAGSTNITTVGTISSGTWQGSAISSSYIGNLPASKITSGTLGIARGGTNKSTIAAYSIWYASAKDTLAELTANTTATKKFLSMKGTGSAGAAPEWSTVSATDVGLSNVSNDATLNKTTGSKGDMIYWSADDTPARLAIGTAGYFLKATADGPAWANTTDITALGTITTGTWSATTIAVTKGGTGTTTAPTKGGIIYGSSTTAYASTAAGSSGQYLKSNGANAPTWATFSASTVGLGNVTNDAQIPKSVFTAGYQIMYSTAASTPAVLDANDTTTKKFLSMTGTGSAGAAPAWVTVSKSDVGLGNVTNDAQIPKSIGTTKGDIIYWTGSSAPARLAIGSAGQILKATSNGPAWSTFSAGSLPSMSGSNASASVANGTLTLVNGTLSLSQGSLPSFS